MPVSLDLIQSLVSSEIGWDRGLLGEKLVDEVLPYLTNEPVLVVFWGEEPRFFSRGLSDNIADAIQNQLLAPQGRSNVMKSVKAGDGCIFSVPISLIAPGDPKLRLHLSDEMVVARLGKSIPLRRRGRDFAVAFASASCSSITFFVPVADISGVNPAVFGFLAVAGCSAVVAGAGAAAARVCFTSGLS